MSALHSRPAEVPGLGPIAAAPERDCPLCGARPARPWREGASLAECASCGLLFRAFRTGAEESDYWSGYNSNSIEQNYDRHRARYYRTVWRLLASLPRRRSSPPTVLDVGCVPGMLLREAKADGWEIHGCEINQDLCDATEKFCGARMWCGFLEDIDFGTQRFDLITMSDVFRAVTNPLPALRKARSALNPGGVMMIREIDRDHPKHADRVAKPYRYDQQFMNPPTARRFMLDAGFSSVDLLNSPMSLLTVPRIYKIAREKPGVYGAILGAVNAAIAATGPIARLRGRPLTSSMLVVGRT